MSLQRKQNEDDKQKSLLEFSTESRNWSTAGDIWSLLNSSIKNLCVKKSFTSFMWGQGDSALSKTLVLQTRGPEFMPKNSWDKTQEWFVSLALETWGSLTAQRSRIPSLRAVRPCLQNGGIWGLSLKVSLWLLYAHTCMFVQTRTHTHPQHTHTHTTAHTHRNRKGKRKIITGSRWTKACMWGYRNICKVDLWAKRKSKMLIGNLSLNCGRLYFQDSFL